MWTLTIRSPNGEPRQHQLQPGNNTIGRMSGNDIVILDPSASRFHAKVVLEDKNQSITLFDLGSTNGTYVNRDRIGSPRTLEENDVIRIGQHTMDLTRVDEQEDAKPKQLKNTQMLTRELLIESLDQNAVLLTEVAARLNTVTDVDAALREVSNLMKVSMGADRSEVILIEKLSQLSELGFATSIARQALEQRSAVIVHDAGQAFGKSASLLKIHAAMCVPVIAGDDILALIYVFKNRPQARAFNQRDLQLAIAIGHQAALTIQRMKLIEQVKREELVSKLLRRFLSPQEADYVLQDYLQYGQLPPLSEHTLTILAADICESTKLAERLGARRFSQILNRYYEEMTSAVFSNNGMLNKYLGDGLMAVFGMPQQSGNPEERAVSAAKDMLTRLEKLNQTFEEDIHIGIGINTGPTVAGYMGTRDYIEFTVLGYPVNIAWGLEALARPDRIFIGHPTYQIISNSVTVTPIGEVSIKEQSDPINAYEVIWK
jgi:adenylate cyclase